MTENNAPLSIQQERETYIREDGTSFTRADIFVKLSVVFRDTMLSALKGPKLSVYLCIALHCSGETMIAWPSIATIAKETGYGHTAVIAAAQDLRRMNLIEIEHREKPDGSPNSNRYKVQGLITMGGSTPSVQGVVHEKNMGSTPSVPKEETMEEETMEETPDVSSADDPPKKSIKEFAGYLSMCAEVEKRNNGTPSWAMDGPEGANPYYEVLLAFCVMIKRDASQIKTRQGRKWLKKYAEIAAACGASPTHLLEAHKFLPDEEWGEWYLEHHQWGDPFVPTYSSRLGQAAQQIANGTITTKNGWSKAMS